MSIDWKSAPRLLDWIQVRQEGGKKQELGDLAPDGLGHRGHPVRVQVVQHDDVACPERRQEDLPDEGQEHVTLVFGGD